MIVIYIIHIFCGLNRQNCFLFCLLHNEIDSIVHVSSFLITISVKMNPKGVFNWPTFIIYLRYLDILKHFDYVSFSIQFFKYKLLTSCLWQFQVLNLLFESSVWIWSNRLLCFKLDLLSNSDVLSLFCNWKSFFVSNNLDLLFQGFSTVFHCKYPTLIPLSCF